MGTVPKKLYQAMVVFFISAEDMDSALTRAEGMVTHIGEFTTVQMPELLDVTESDHLMEEKSD